MNGNSEGLITTHARGIGADAVASIAPFFFKPGGHEGLTEWCQALELDGGRYDLLWGRDEMLLGAMINGMVETGSFFVALKAMLRVPISTKVRAPLPNLPEGSYPIPDEPTF